jgi:HEAT repeat protein
MKRLILLAACAGLVWGQSQEPPADPKQRAKMVRDYAKSGGEVAHIAPYVRDPDLEVQRTAVEALVKLGGAASLDPLVEATRIADEETQIRATDGLVNFYSPGYLQIGLSGSFRRAGNSIKANFTDTNDAVVAAHVKVRDDVVNAVAKLVSGGASILVQANAARAAGVLRGRAALPEIYKALRTKDSRVMYESLVAAEKIGDPAAGAEIVFLVRDLDEKVQIAAIEAVGQLQYKPAVPRLSELMTSQRSSKVKRAALVAIAKMPEPSSRSLYETYRNDGDEHLRAAAAEGIARLRRPEDRAGIEADFQSEGKKTAQLSLAFAAVMLGDREVSEHSPLLYLLNTLNSNSYKGIAYPFLIELCRDQAARAAVIGAIPGMNRNEKTQIAEILANTGGSDSEKALIEMSRDTDVHVAQAAALALRTLRVKMGK